MGQVSPCLRRATNGYSHWCPGCKEVHLIPDTWTFEGNVNIPTFRPSVKITSKKTIRDDRGNWLGDWERDAAGNAIDSCCHYVLTGGQLQFCVDSTHALAGQTVPLPELPQWLTDP
jgi:hypothetical protein